MTRLSNTIRYVCLLISLSSCQAAQLWVQSFDHVWQTIHDKHWDPSLNGVDWQAARTELRPKVELATSNAEARPILESLLARLGHSHVGIIPASVYTDIESNRQQGETNLKFHIIGGDAVIASGPYSGWVLREVNGRRVRDRIARAKGEVYAHSAITNMLRGEPGETLDVLLEDESGKAVAARLDLTRPTGRLSRFGNLPPLQFEHYFEPVTPGVGYIRLSIFFEPDSIQRVLTQAIESCKDCAGIILDLRGNPGGIGALAAAVAGWFVDRESALGTLEMRNAKLKLVAIPRVNPFLGKLAVLVDGRSMSTSEILAGGLKDLQRARIFGTRTPGMALPSSIEKLPTGDGFQYTFANYISAGGKPLEGTGVQPDVTIEPTRQQLRSGHDAARAAAIEWIQTK